MECVGEIVNSYNYLCDISFSDSLIYKLIIRSNFHSRSIYSLQKSISPVCMYICMYISKMNITKKHCFSGTKTFQVIQNSSLSLECISKIYKRKNERQISTFNFSTLYTEILHDKLLDILYKVVGFMFKGGTRDYIIINKQGGASWSSKKRGHHFAFTKSLLKEAIKFILHNCFSSIGIS